MHDVGVAVEAALQEEFPDADISAREVPYKTVLGVTFRVGTRRLVAYTPREVDYRQLSKERWLHRFREIIKEARQ